MTRRTLTALAATLVLSAAVATPALAGPPWLSIELPANPLDPTTKGAFLVVRTYHHDKTVDFQLEARAEGFVNGKRTTIPLTLERTSREGAYALKQTWPTAGDWVLVITGMPGEGSVTALVSVSDGNVRNVRVPSKVVENGRWTVPTQVTQSDVEAELKSLVALASR
jgi:hypothetical protein